MVVENSKYQNSWVSENRCGYVKVEVSRVATLHQTEFWIVYWKTSNVAKVVGGAAEEYCRAYRSWKTANRFLPSCVWIRLGWGFEVDHKFQFKLSYATWSASPKVSHRESMGKVGRWRVCGESTNWKGQPSVFLLCKTCGGTALFSGTIFNWISLYSPLEIYCFLQISQGNATRSCSR